jgi:hypothetical protein
VLIEARNPANRPIIKGFNALQSYFFRSVKQRVEFTCDGKPVPMSLTI